MFSIYPYLVGKIFLKNIFSFYYILLLYKINSFCNINHFVYFECIKYITLRLYIPQILYSLNNIKSIPQFVQGKSQCDRKNIYI